jgi:hypothetical protein
MRYILAIARVCRVTLANQHSKVSSAHQTSQYELGHDDLRLEISLRSGISSTSQWDSMKHGFLCHVYVALRMQALSVPLRWHR